MTCQTFPPTSNHDLLLSEAADQWCRGGPQSCVQVQALPALRTSGQRLQLKLYLSYHKQTFWLVDTSQLYGLLRSSLYQRKTRTEQFPVSKWKWCFCLWKESCVENKQEIRDQMARHEGLSSKRNTASRGNLETSFLRFEIR